jgi:hypothetical protein
LDAVERRKFAVSAQDPSDPFLKVPKHGLHSPRLPNDFSHPRVGLVLGALPRLTQALPQHSWNFERFLQLLDPGEDFVHVLKRGRSLYLGFCYRVVAEAGTNWEAFALGSDSMVALGIRDQRQARGRIPNHAAKKRRVFQAARSLPLELAEQAIVRPERSAFAQGLG